MDTKLCQNLYVAILSTTVKFGGVALAAAAPFLPFPSRRGCAMVTVTTCLRVKGMATDIVTAIAITVAMVRANRRTKIR